MDIMQRLILSRCARTMVKGVICGVIAFEAGTAPVCAQSFADMWKQVEAAERKDQSKTVVETLQRIQRRAERQKSYGNLLYAMIKECHAQRQISPDSVDAARKRLVDKQSVWRATDGVLAAVCQTVMYRDQGAPKVDSLLASKDAEEYLKKHSEDDFKPLVEHGEDSKYFDENLLAVIAMYTEQQRALYNYYASKGDRKAACVAAAKWMEQEGTLQQVDSLISIYQDLPECGALAVRRYDKMITESAEKRIKWIDEALRRWPEWKENNVLRNARKSIINPHFGAELEHNKVTTDTDVMLRLYNICNVRGVKVTLRHVNPKAKNGYDLVREYSKRIKLKNDYDSVVDSISLGRLPLGEWKVIVTDTDGKVKRRTSRLYVTDLTVLSIPQPKNRMRVVVVNSITGRPVAGARLYIRRNGSNEKETRVTVDEHGEYIYNIPAKAYNGFTLRATKGGDNAMRPVKANASYNFHRDKDTRTVCNIYTDRAIYRPGQTVRVALVDYTVSGSMDVAAKQGDTLTLVLRDSHYKEIASKTVVTDAMGAAAVDFELPKEGRNGVWAITTKFGRERIRVEAYKRPTFDVTLEKPTVAYNDGDTLIVKGTARTYSGVPVADARVAYNVRRNRQWWWISAENSDAELLKDTVQTAADGSFVVKMPMRLPKKGQEFMPRYYNIEAVASVTDKAGESHSAVISLPLSNREAYLSCNMAGEILADSAITITVARRNAAGKEIDGRVKMFLDGKEQGEAEANKPYALAENIASGRHKLMAVCEGDTVRNTFVAFRKSDERPMIYTHQWNYQSGNAFPNDGGEVWMQVGSSDNDVTAFYSVFAGDSIIAQGTRRIDNENITHTLSYKEDYGDGLTISYVWVKNGKVYDHCMRFARPLASKKLDMKWTTFRDRLVPGQKEEWSVRITAPDGSPVNARMMAVLYDKSLEQLARHQWSFNDTRYVRPVYASWSSGYNPFVNMWLAASMVPQKVDALSFSRVRGDVYYIYDLSDKFMTRSYGRIQGLGKSAMLTKQAVKLQELKTTVPDIAVAESAVSMDAVYNGVTNEDEAMSPNTGESEESVAMRSDFAETAFFMPALITDTAGVATMRFTLPESVTTWRFMALAHDDNMRNATLVGDAVAQKPLMIQPNMPRFLRYGDNAMVSATVANLADTLQNVVTTMTILDAKDERSLFSQTQKVTVKNGETGVVTFPIDADRLSEGTYICRFTAQGQKHTDGEQRYLVVLSDEESVTTTAAYTFTAPTDTLLDLAGMVPEKVKKAHMKVEYVDNPAWLMMETLPEIARPDGKNAVSLSAALYAERVAASLKWKENKADSVLNALQALQNADGSFSWWEGMPGNVYMTTAVTKTLVRLNKLCGKQTDTQRMLDKAFSFLQKEMDDDVRKMKQRERKHHVTIGQTHLDWLYALTLEQRKGGVAADYLLSHVVRDLNKSDMQTKAVAAIVLNNNGRRSDARTFVEAIKQHTVYRKDVGRYFDSYRAEYSWCDYRIPTQSFAIEAMRDVTPKDRQTIAEMQRWLLNSKRTQKWDNPYNTVNAVHAFFEGDMSVLKYENGKQTIADKEVTRKEAKVPLRKHTDCESWAAAYMTFKQKVDEVKTASMGLAVRREVMLNGQKTDGRNVKVGDKVVVRITVTADRDYDFVSIVDNKAACLEPVSVTSGYYGEYYREVKDAGVAFYFNQLAKGEYVLQTEYYVDRTGEYCSGTVTAECAYANEFRGTEGAYSMTIKK